MEEDTHGVLSTIIDLVSVDYEVVTAFRGDDTCGGKRYRSAVRSNINIRNV